MSSQARCPLAIPATLHDSLMARLDRLATVKDVAQLGATIGRAFAYELPAGSLSLRRSNVTARPASSWWRRSWCISGVCRRKPPIRSSMRSSRMRRISRCCGALASSITSALHRCWSSDFPRRLRRNPTTGASLHRGWLECAGHPLLAAAGPAGTPALGLCRSDWASHHRDRGAPDPARHPRTGPARTRAARRPRGALIGTKSYSAPEVEHSFARARALCQQLGETPEFFHILYGLWRITT